MKKEPIYVNLVNMDHRFIDAYPTEYTDEEMILKSFEAEYGEKCMSLCQKIEFANNLSEEGQYTKEFILEVLSSKKYY